MSESMMERVAQPGDVDVVFDVDGLTVTSVISEDRELMVRSTGGFGWWINGDGTRCDFDPGDPESSVTEVEIVAAFPGAPQNVFDHLVSKLERWRDTSVPVRYVSAPGRMSSLIADVDDWVPLPGNPFPNQV